MNPIKIKFAPKKRHKFRAKPLNGYASTKEAKRAEILKLMQRNGQISDLREQVRFELLPKQEIKCFNGKTICGRRAMTYIADFVYSENGAVVVEDCKGFKTRQYIQKKNLMRKIYGIIIKET